MHVIVVESDEDYRSLVCNYLTKHLSDVTVTGVQVGEAALQLVATRSADLVITPYHLLGMSGLELIRALCQQAPAVPLIVFSGEADVAHAAQAAGAVRFVGKAEGLKALLAAVRSVLPSAPSASAV